MNRQEGIDTVYGGPSHVVILGAGASIASVVRDTEPAKKRLPSMDNFIEVLDLAGMLEAAGVDPHVTNFESAYSDLYTKDPDARVIRQIESRVKEYFETLTLPATPTIYDYLMLSLRRKDLIATFNWDPFLYQAFYAIDDSATDPVYLSFMVA
jgi:hypothetical protein